MHCLRVEQYIGFVYFCTQYEAGLDSLYIVIAASTLWRYAILYLAKIVVRIQILDKKVQLNRFSFRNAYQRKITGQYM